MGKSPGQPSERTRLERIHERGTYDRKNIDAILDATPLCHVGYLLDGAPIVTPTLQWREDDHVYWHGSSASRMLRKSADTEVCLTVSLLDGLVLARSGFHHSVNFGSVMLLAEAKLVQGPKEKAARLKTFVDGIFPGRWEELRPLTAQELKATTVLSMPISEV